MEEREHDIRSMADNISVTIEGTQAILRILLDDLESQEDATAEAHCPGAYKIFFDYFFNTTFKALYAVSRDIEEIAGSLAAAGF